MHGARIKIHKTFVSRFGRGSSAKLKSSTKREGFFCRAQIAKSHDLNHLAIPTCDSCNARRSFANIDKVKVVIPLYAT